MATQAHTVILLNRFLGGFKRFGVGKLLKNKLMYVDY